MQRILTISSKLRNIEHVREFVRQIFKESNLNMNSFNRIFLGISEAVNNAMIHGNHMNPEKNVFIKMNLQGNTINVEVEDEGNGFNDLHLFDPTNRENIKHEHGRGIYILSKIADELTFKDNGKRVFIQFTIPE
ncbi:MAG: ATP-binding protein [Methylococcaceae bacterium]